VGNQPKCKEHLLEKRACGAAACGGLLSDVDDCGACSAKGGPGAGRNQAGGGGSGGFTVSKEHHEWVLRMKNAEWDLKRKELELALSQRSSEMELANGHRRLELDRKRMISDNELANERRQLVDEAAEKARVLEGELARKHRQMEVDAKQVEATQQAKAQEQWAKMNETNVGMFRHQMESKSIEQLSTNFMMSNIVSALAGGGGLMFDPRPSLEGSNPAAYLHQRPLHSLLGLNNGGAIKRRRLDSAHGPVPLAPAPAVPSAASGGGGGGLEEEGGDGGEP
jgi:hypothetical protein